MAGRKRWSVSVLLVQQNSYCGAGCLPVTTRCNAVHFTTRSTFATNALRIGGFTTIHSRLLTSLSKTSIARLLTLDYELCAPFIDRSNAAYICASSRGCRVCCGGWCSLFVGSLNILSEYVSRLTRAYLRQLQPSSLRGSLYHHNSDSIGGIEPLPPSSQSSGALPMSFQCCPSCELRIAGATLVTVKLNLFGIGPLN